MMPRPHVEEILTRHLKGMIALCDEARGFTKQGSTVDDLLRDLATKSGSILLELRKEPLKA